MTDSVTLAIVGIDGASPNIYGQFLDSLPTFQRLLDEGSGGTLHSTIPPITGPAWTTMMTGKGPGKHGVFDMTTPESDYEIEPLKGNADQPMLFDHVEDSLFLNVPGTYRREPSGDALLVNSFDSPSVDEAIPEELSHLDAAEDYVLSNPKGSYSDEVAYVERLREIEAKRFALLKESLTATGDQELLFVLFSSTDWGLHFLSTDGTAGWKEYRRLYEDIDGYLEWIDDISENLVVLSDHGFEQKRTRVNLSRYLHSNGHLSVSTGDGAQHLNERVLGSVTRGVSSLSNRSKLVRRTVQWGIDNVLSDDFVSEARDSWNIQISWDETAAFPVGYQGIYLNDDRFEQATVGDGAALRAEIAAGLRELTTPDGRPVFEDVVEREAIYDGAFVSDAPDLVCLPKPHVSCHSTFNANDSVVNDVDFYDHRPDGMFVVSGPLFEGGQGLDADIADIAPTVLHFLGQEVPRSMDGSVLTKLDAGSREVAYTDAEPTPGAYTETDNESDEVKDRLEDLGYM